MNGIKLSILGLGVCILGLNIGAEVGGVIGLVGLSVILWSFIVKDKIKN